LVSVRNKGKKYGANLIGPAFNKSATFLRRFPTKL
jgi:hypothetical protein